MWSNGPSWLSLPMQQWPNSKTLELDASLEEQVEVELKGTDTLLEHDLVASLTHIVYITLKNVNGKK